MRVSRIPLKTLREAPGSAAGPGRQLLRRSGQLSAPGSGHEAMGVLLTRSLQKLTEIAHAEFASAGAHPVAASAGSDIELLDALLRHLSVSSDSYKSLPLRVSAPCVASDERGGGRRILAALAADRSSEFGRSSMAELSEAAERVFVRAGIRLDELAGADREAAERVWFARCESGDDLALLCDSCGRGALQEHARARISAVQGGDARALRREDTPGVRSVQELEQFFDLPASRMAKTILFECDDSSRSEVIAVLMRGDLEIDERKLRRVLAASSVRVAGKESVERVTGAELGFAGPVGLREPVRLLADESLRGQGNLLTGCCTTDAHCLNVNAGRDFPEPEYADLALVTEGMLCAADGRGVLHERRGIALGRSLRVPEAHVRELDALFVDEDGGRKPYVVSASILELDQVLWAVAEQHHDADGLRWPLAIAPFQLVVAVLDPRREEQRELGERLYRDLMAAGIDLCLDDREISPGAKFKDLDLIGYPIRVVVGRDAGQEEVEFSRRGDERATKIRAADVHARL